MRYVQSDYRKCPKHEVDHAESDDSSISDFVKQNRYVLIAVDKDDLVGGDREELVPRELLALLVLPRNHASKRHESDHG